jgi:CheY-like chemotaxis protein
MRILVIDSDAEVLKTTKGVIQSLGYEVLALADGAQALEAISHRKFDGVFLDSRMSLEGDSALIRHIRQSSSNNSVPIVMLAAVEDVETMRAGFRAGITFFMGKPPDVKQVSDILRLMRGVMLREKRSYVRLPLRTVVSCRTEGHQFTSGSLNISEGGMLLDASGGLEAGQQVELLFSLPPTPGQLNPHAQVIRREPPDRMAVKFVGLSAESREAVQAYISVRVKG